MNNKIKPIVFFGTEEFSAISLQALIDAGFEISAIITKPDSRKGRGQKLQAPTVKKIGEKFNIPVLQPSKMNEIVDFVENLPVRPIGVLVSFGRIIPQNIIELFDGGIVNVHPSLLPKYRGPSPIESAIFNGDEKTGVSIMSLSKEMDAGDVYIQEEFPLKGNETSSELYETCGKIGAEMLINHLPAIMSAKMTANPQNESEATYCQLLKKSDAILNPEIQTAEQAERQIRAFEIFPKSNAPDYETDDIYKALLAQGGGQNVKSEYAAMKWLQVNRPDFTQIVAVVMDEMKGELRANIDKIVG